MEPIEDQWQLLRRDGVAIVGDGDIGLGPALLDFQPQGTAIRAELHGIVDQVVDNLGNIVLVGKGEHRMVRHIHFHVDVFVVDFLFKGQQHLAGSILQVKLDLLLIRNALLSLELRDIQHTADQSGQALGLVGDDL